MLAPGGDSSSYATADVQRARRVIAGIVLAIGEPGEADVVRANQAFAALGWAPLAAHDLVRETPEALAPTVPDELRPAFLHIVYELAGDEPIRRRLADAYAGLWQMDARSAAVPAPAAAPADAPPSSGPPLVRWLIGKLPRHHIGRAAKEDAMIERGPYRGGEVAEAQHAPAERSPLRRQVERIRAEYLQVVDTVERVIVGKRDVIERVLTAMAARGHVLLVDVPGVGKTQLCKAIAASIDTRFGRIQFTPDLLPMDITGANVFDVRDKQFHFRPGPIFTHILLADEINRATPKTQSALLEVMEERCATVDGTTHQLDEPFQVLATMNPLDHQGTYALPAAQIDRFMVMLEIGYPSVDDEIRVLDFHLGVTPPLAGIQPVISRAAFLDWRATVPYIHVSPEIKRTAVGYIDGLRRTIGETCAISPRATIAWVRCAQARAMLAGREFVAIDDLLDVAADVLRHRLPSDGVRVYDRLRAIANAGAPARPAPMPALRARS
jgi:MoxR-like ATPase